MSDPVKVADAFLCPRDYPHGEVDRDFARNALFGPALGSERVQSRSIEIMPEGRSLVTRAKSTGMTFEGKSYHYDEGDHTTFQFPKKDPRHPDTCHDWFVASTTEDAPGFVAGRPAKPGDYMGSTILIGFKKDKSDAN